jgi:hypothetical protein
MAEKKEERKADRVVVESEERAFEAGQQIRAGTSRESNVISEKDTEQESESGPAGESAKKSARWQGT